MNFEENDKPLIKSISSNIIRIGRAEDYISKVKYLTKVVEEATIFSSILKDRGDFEHSKEYIETAMNIHRMLGNIIQNKYNLIFAGYYMEKEMKK